MDPLDVIPLIERDEAAIRADADATANLGKAPDDPTWVDTREGSMFWICTQPMVVESAKWYSVTGFELVAAMSIETAWGEYLDQHAASYNLERKAATAAEVVLRFSGPDGTLIASDVEVSVAQTDPEIEPPT